MCDYSQELQVNVEAVDVNTDGTLKVTIFVRGVKKILTTNEQELKQVVFSPGEKVRLLYTSADNWTIKKYLDMSPVDKYFRKD